MTARNLLFIFSDQHASRVTGCYGDPHVHTPALDALAARGVRFDNAYCPSPICTPSRAAMLTACHPHRQECWTNDDHLASNMPTWLHALGAAGHRPELIGRLHAIGPDQLHGYVAREIGDHSPNWPGVPFHDLGALARTNNPEPESVVACGAGQSAYEVKDRDVTEAALSALDRHAEAGTPFAMTVGLMLPHAPYVAARRWVDHYMQVLDPPVIPSDANPHPWIDWWRKNRGITDVPDRKSRLARAAYWGLVSTMDEMIGRILDRLDDRGMRDDTLVVYASDHGDHVGDRGLWWKHTFFDESARVPILMSLPGVLEEGSVCADVVSLIDLSQTMIEAMGGKVLPHADGRSFWGNLTGGGQDWDNTIFCEYCYDAVPAWTGGRAVQQRMVRQGRWKLHFYAGQPPLLFDMEADPQEQRNLAGDPANAEIVGELTALVLDGWDPKAIAARMRIRRDRKDVQAEWAARTLPASTCIWPVRADMNWLDQEP